MNDKPVALDGFTYQPLGENEIRLLTLHPGYGQDPISCSIVNVSLLNKPEYEALSYAWGDPGDERIMYLEGQEMQIRKNLWEALHHIRCPRNPLSFAYHALGWEVEKKERAIWIDALCINQQDIKERNHQVMLMQKIYREAKTVIAWLGVESQGSTMLLNCIKEQGNWFISEREESEAISGIRVTDAAAHLQEREYWQRLWIIQEFTLARDLLLVCGWDQCTWYIFHDWPGWQRFRGDKDSCFSSVFNLRSNFHESNDLAEFVSFSRRSACTDPRDRVYGILGLLGKASLGGKTRVIMPVDYSKSLWEVYVDAIRFKIECLREERSYPDVCETSKVDGWSRETANIYERICFADFSADLQQALGPEVGREAALSGGEEIMSILAQPRGIVKYFGPVYDPVTLTHRQDTAFWSRVQKLAAKVRKKYFGEDCRNKGLYVFEDWYLKKVVDLSKSDILQSARNAFRFDVDPKDLKTLLEEWETTSATISNSPASGETQASRFRYILTSDGYLGLAPTSVQMCDVVATYGSLTSERMTSACIVRYKGVQGEVELVGRCLVFQKTKDTMGAKLKTKESPVMVNLDIRTLQLLTA